MLNKQNSFSDDSDDSQLTYHHNNILAVLDDMELDEIDNDFDTIANQTHADDNDNELDDNEIQDPTTKLPTSPKISTPPKTTSKKRKRGISAHILRVWCTNPLFLIDINDEPALRPVTKEISYMVSIFSASEMKKSKSKREPINASFDLRTDKPWDTLKAQILAKISAAINPRTLCFDDYLLTYYIYRVLPKPGLSLMAQTDYDGLMKRVNGMAAKTPTVNISVIQILPAGDEKFANEGQEMDELELGLKSKSKKRVSIKIMLIVVSPRLSLQKESAAILPGNEKKVKNIQLLRDRWVCKKTDSACASTHCYVNPGTDEHTPLGHQQLDCWASAMVHFPLCV